MIRGIETTEWWGTVLMHVITLLTLFGVTTHFTSEQVQAVATVAALIGSAVAQAVYTHSRQVIKTQPTPLGPVMSATLPVNEAGPAPSSAT